MINQESRCKIKKDWFVKEIEKKKQKKKNLWKGSQLSSEETTQLQIRENCFTREYDQEEKVMFEYYDDG